MNAAARNVPVVRPRVATRWHSSPLTVYARFTTDAQRVVMTGITRDSSPDRSEPFARSHQPFSLRCVGSGTKLPPTLDDPRLTRLRDLIQEVVRLQETTKRLIVELGDQIRRTESRRKPASQTDRRRKPRR